MANGNTKRRIREFYNATEVRTSVPIHRRKKKTIRFASRRLDFQNDGHDQRPAAGGFLDEALQLDADLFLDHAVVGFLLAAEAHRES